MARSIRIEHGGASYHVMARGNRRQPIFMDEDDRRFFLPCLAEVCEKTGRLGSAQHGYSIAQEIWKETTVSQRWIAEKLEMRNAANVSQSLHRRLEGAKQRSEDIRKRKKMHTGT